MALESGWKKAPASEWQIHILESLLHYHERATMAARLDVDASKCPSLAVIDEYAEALREAIRCMRVVYCSADCLNDANEDCAHSLQR